MDEYIKKIYELLYSPIITPYNLLENAKLDNYKYVKYYKNKIGLICEMKCLMELEEEVIFYYHFDNNDSLFKIYMKQNGKQDKVFDREVELERTKEEYLNNSDNANRKAI